MFMTAGLGTRLRPFTDVTAKPILPLMGVPMAQFGLDQLARAGVTHVVANVHHLAQATSQALRFLEGPKVWTISDESELLLGSAGGIAKAAPHLEGAPFFLLNADTISNVNLKDLAQHHAYLRHQFGVRLTLAILAKGPAGARYREIHVDERRSMVRSLGEPAEGRPFFVGAAVVEPDALALIDPATPSEFVPKILQPAVQMGKAGAYLIDNTLESEASSWFDIGSPELWHSTHFALMRLLENEEIPTAWKERILRHNRRVGPEQWISSRATEDPATIPHGPFYWAPDGGDPRPPDRLSARQVIYGQPPANAEGPGIGYRGLWAPIA